ncbi:hypothetical protein Pryu01_01847 [Paraliobacillus ryukyuensis]|uniref:TIGR04086 family membrane protein n=1 Tax=Paraliobacillus ryukyuensis TaxID=200904 RepID=A0A366DSW4_9BACI|nr:hypothetical protein [Paraliobacillus ryukyuensis]RBO93187.1 hypothetical protein DES48_11353 [Paraliobacillus ryukyuensis]
MVNKALIFGIVTTLFATVTILINQEQLLLLPFTQLFLGFIIAYTLVAGMQAFRNNSTGMGFVFSFITLVLIGIIVCYNSMTINGWLPLVFVYLTVGIPIGCIAFVLRVKK